MNNTITSFNPTICRSLASEIESALKPLAEKYGLSIHAGNGSYGQTNFVQKVEFRLTETVEGKKALAAEFAKYAEWYGLPTDSYGKTFTKSGITHRIDRINPKATSKPIITVASNGHQYKFSADSIKEILGLPVRKPTLELVHRGKHE